MSGAPREGLACYNPLLLTARVRAAESEQRSFKLLSFEVLILSDLYAMMQIF